MVKTKYERMNKENKKKVVDAYKKTLDGKVMMMRLLRLKLIGIIGLVFSICLIIFQYNDLKWTDFLSAISLFFASIIFLVSSFKLKKKNLNNFAIKNKIG